LLSLNAAKSFGGFGLAFVLVCQHREETPMSETRKLAAILVADVVGYSRLAAADEERTLARLRALRGDLIDPAIAAHHGRIVKRTGDGSIIEFRSVVDAVRCAIEVQNAMVERNSGLPKERQIQFRVGIHVGDVVEESDGDLMGDGVNIAARLEGIAKAGGICLSEDAYRHVKSRLEIRVSDLGVVELKNISERVRAFSLDIGPTAEKFNAKGVPVLLSRRRLWFAAVAVAAIIAAGVVTVLHPFDWYFLNRGESEFLAGHPKEAIESYGHARRLDLKGQVLLIASYVKAGLGDEARLQAHKFLVKNPKFSVNEFLRKEPTMEKLASDAELKDSLVSSGLPLEVRWECLTQNVCP
jgi:class 3 adenylate cyclase